MWTEVRDHNIKLKKTIPAWKMEFEYSNGAGERTWNWAAKSDGMRH
jgi:hypothetical protein